MRIPIIILVVTIVTGGDLLAQKTSTSSKKQATFKEYQSKSPSTNVTSLLADALKLKTSNPSEALNKVQEALAVSVADGNVFNEAKCYLLIGGINEQINEWFLARDNYLKANQILGDGYKSTAEFGSSLVGLGKSNLELKEFRNSLQYYQAAKSSRGVNQSEVSLNISEVYYQIGNYSEALKSLDEIPSRKISSNDFDIRIQNQRSKIQAKLNQNATNDLYSNSLNSLRKGENVAPQAQQSLTETKEEIASTYRSQQRYDDEIDLRSKSIEFNQEIKNFEEVAKDKVEISKTLEAKGENLAALKEMEDAARIIDTINNPKAKSEAFLALAKLYEKNGRLNQAVKAYQEYAFSVEALESADDAKFKMKEGLINQQQAIEELKNDISSGRQDFVLQEATVFRQQLIIYGLIAIILIIGTASFFLFRSAQARQAANQLLALKSLRSQMNPHFIFNALNSVNHFIAQQDERSANKFLSEFSQLMRLVLDNSQEDFISLSKEQEMLSLYVKLEHYRFRDKFDYEFYVEEGINNEAIELPPMLIQPYIENAVWHGLRYKESKGNLKVRFTKVENEIQVEIADDGIGRMKSTKLKTSNQRLHKSTGLKNIKERLGIINKVYRSNYRVLIEDLPDDSGTTVKIYLPTRNQTAA